MHAEGRGPVEMDGPPAESLAGETDPTKWDRRSTAPAGVVAKLDGLAPTSVGRGEKSSRALNSYAVLLACCILILICSGGMVTSKGAGLAVPDWPNSYGYNMFAFPVSRWVGAVLLEHTHRLAASVVGLLTIGLTVWLAKAEPRRWVQKLGYAALALVILQGVLGGIRVVYRADWVGIFHGCVAQAFLALVSVIALVTSRWWWTLHELNPRRPAPVALKGFARLLLATAVLIYLQLALGATMRHAHAGLSIHDFPKAYGHWWPQIHKADLPALNLYRDETLHEPPTTIAQIHLQMQHRMNAIFIAGCVLATGMVAWRRRDSLPGALRWLVTAGIGLVAAQITLGIYTIWSDKAADIATAHVAMGATLFVWSVVSYVALRRWMDGSMSATARASGPAREDLHLEAVAA